MADEGKKKKAISYTHWARPRVRTYEYNFEYGESYYRPLVRYISTSSASSQLISSSSSSTQVETRRSRTARRRAASPPGALSFIERWTNEPFYGYGVGFRSKMSSTSEQSSMISSEIQSRSIQQQQQQSLSATSTDIRSRRARSVEAASRYASDDCLMRSTALDRAASVLSASAEAASADVLKTSSLTRKTLVLDNKNVLHGKTLDERHYLDYPKQHLVCPENCPLHNNPEWRRRFLIGNRFLDAAALGGFDVLYDPTVYTSSRKLLAKLAQSKESEVEEIVIERSSESESSRRRIRATIY